MIANGVVKLDKTVGIKQKSKRSSSEASKQHIFQKYDNMLMYTIYKTSHLPPEFFYKLCGMLRLFMHIYIYATFLHHADQFAQRI